MSSKPHKGNMVKNASSLVVRALANRSDWSEQCDFWTKSLDELALAAERMAFDKSLKFSPRNVGGSTMIGGSIAYWLGWLALPMWFPALGAALGTAGAMGILAGFKWWSDAHRNYEFIKVCYAGLLTMEMADGVITREEQQQLSEFISSLPLTISEKDDLKAMQPESADAFSAPDWLTDDQKRVILSTCWSLACCDGVDSSEEKLYDKLANRLRIDFEERELIKAKVARVLAMVEHRLEKMFAVSSYLVAESCQDDPDQSQQIQGKISDILVGINPNSGSDNPKLKLPSGKSKLADLAESINSEPDFAQAILAGGYFLASVHSKNSCAGSLKKLASEAGISDTAIEITSRMDPFVAKILSL